ncbi:hypothetical protein EDD15DRAFT_297299 [Pisolithus albus]|nr:hypothetical protein EDD15DRAFT_297299 [Pisolithus albus]
MAYCNRCDRTFSSQSAYSQHIRDSSRHNICDDCDEDFVEERSLIQHYKSSPSHHYCSDCDLHFDDEDELLDHYRTENGHAYCDWCNKVLRGQRGLDDHNKSCHYPCELCDRVFFTENERRHHLKSKTHQSANIPCNCGKLFNSHAALILHFEPGYCPDEPDIDRHVVKQHVREIERRHRNRRLLVYDPDYEERVYRCPDPSCTRRKFITFSALFQHLESESCDASKSQALKLLAGVLRRIYGAPPF